MDTDTFKFSCNVNTNFLKNPIRLDILLNDENVFSKLINSEEQVEFNVPDIDDKEWTIKFIVSGKNDSHIIRDDNGNIVDSTELSITDISFDEININNIIALNPLPYKHNFNGNGEEIIDKFYDTAGCNGEITLNFTTPIYLWLLENM